jgi:hypothetical protein
MPLCMWGAAYFNILRPRLFVEATLRVHGIRAIQACITVAGWLGSLLGSWEFQQ